MTFNCKRDLIGLIELLNNNLAGEQALSKALVASRLCQAMADEAADDDLDVEIYEELSSFGKEFEELCKCRCYSIQSTLRLCLLSRLAAVHRFHARCYGGKISQAGSIDWNI